MAVPTREEINPFDDLDGRKACEHFLGRDVDEAEALFHENDLYYQEDLMWMGAPAFRFYLPAVDRFIRNNASDSSEFVAHFVSTLEFRLRYEAAELVPVAEQLADLCSFVLESWSRFESGVAPYGNVRTRIESLRDQFSKCGSADDERHA